MSHRGQLSPSDNAALRMLAGASFTDGARLVLPSGIIFDSDEAQAFTSFYADSADCKGKGTAFIDHHCRPAIFADYQAWLTGYLNNGGHITHSYHYLMPPTWYVLTCSGVIPELYGALSINLIVPCGLSVSGPRTFHGCSGHNNIYLMDGFTNVGMLVPTYIG